MPIIYDDPQTPKGLGSLVSQQDVVQGFSQLLPSLTSTVAAGSGATGNPWDWYKNAGTGLYELIDLFTQPVQPWEWTREEGVLNPILQHGDEMSFWTEQAKALPGQTVEMGKQWLSDISNPFRYVTEDPVFAILDVLGAYGAAARTPARLARIADVASDVTTKTGYLTQALRKAPTAPEGPYIGPDVNRVIDDLLAQSTGRTPDNVTSLDDYKASKFASEFDLDVPGEAVPPKPELKVVKDLPRENLGSDIHDYSHLTDGEEVAIHDGFLASIERQLVAKEPTGTGLDLPVPPAMSPQRSTLATAARRSLLNRIFRPTIEEFKDFLRRLKDEERGGLDFTDLTPEDIDRYIVEWRARRAVERDPMLREPEDLKFGREVTETTSEVWKDLQAGGRAPVGVLPDGGVAWKFGPEDKSIFFRGDDGEIFEYPLAPDDIVIMKEVKGEPGVVAVVKESQLKGMRPYTAYQGAGDLLSPVDRPVGSALAARRERALYPPAGARKPLRKGQSEEWANGLAGVGPNEFKALEEVTNYRDTYKEHLAVRQALTEKYGPKVEEALQEVRRTWQQGGDKEGALHIEELRHDPEHQWINELNEPFGEPVLFHSKSPGTDSVLSNFAETPFEYEGIKYRNAEAAFQAAKNSDPAWKERMSKASALEAKKAGRQVQLRPDWDEVRVQVMEDILKAKFNQSKAADEALFATGQRPLVHQLPSGRDTFWGVDLNGRGANQLGKILEEIRGSTIDPVQLAFADPEFATGYEVLVTKVKKAVDAGQHHVANQILADFLGEAGWNPEFAGRIKYRGREGPRAARVGRGAQGEQFWFDPEGQPHDYPLRQSGQKLGVRQQNILEADPENLRVREQEPTFPALDPDAQSIIDQTLDMSPSEGILYRSMVSGEITSAENVIQAFLRGERYVEGRPVITEKMLEGWLREMKVDPKGPISLVDRLALEKKAAEYRRARAGASVEERVPLSEIMSQPAEARRATSLRNQPRQYPEELFEAEATATEGVKVTPGDPALSAKNAPKGQRTINKVISGMQEGVDQIALELAEKYKIATGGNAPAGFGTHTGKAADTMQYRPELGKRWGLKELPHDKVADKGKYWTKRTYANAKEADGTVWFGEVNTPGYKATAKFGDRPERPMLVNPKSADEIDAWARKYEVKTMNVAGNRPKAKTWTETEANTRRVLEEFFGREEYKYPQGKPKPPGEAGTEVAQPVPSEGRYFPERERAPLPPKEPVPKPKTFPEGSPERIEGEVWLKADRSRREAEAARRNQEHSKLMKEKFPWGGEMHEKPAMQPPHPDYIQPEIEVLDTLIQDMAEGEGAMFLSHTDPFWWDTLKNELSPTDPWVPTAADEMETRLPNYQPDWRNPTHLTAPDQFTGASTPEAVQAWETRLRQITAENDIDEFVYNVIKPKMEEYLEQEAIARKFSIDDIDYSRLNSYLKSLADSYKAQLPMRQDMRYLWQYFPPYDDPDWIPQGIPEALDRAIRIQLARAQEYTNRTVQFAPAWSEIANVPPDTRPWRLGPWPERKLKRSPEKKPRKD